MTSASTAQRSDAGTHSAGAVCVLRILAQSSPGNAVKRSRGRSNMRTYKDDNLKGRVNGLEALVAGRVPVPILEAPHDLRAHMQCRLRGFAGVGGALGDAGATDGIGEVRFPGK